MDDDRIILRIPKNGCDREIVSTLLEDQAESLPFSLPPLVHWPAGARACSNRAIILMRAGLLYLHQQSKHSTYKNDHHSKQNQENEKKTVEPISDIIPTKSPEADIEEQTQNIKKPEFDISLFQ